MKIQPQPQSNLLSLWHTHAHITFLKSLSFLSAVESCCAVCGSHAIKHQNNNICDQCLIGHHQFTLLPADQASDKPTNRAQYFVGEFALGVGIFCPQFREQSCQIFLSCARVCFCVPVSVRVCSKCKIENLS